MCRKLRFSQNIIRSQPIPIEKMSRSKRVNDELRRKSYCYDHYIEGSKLFLLFWVALKRTFVSGDSQVTPTSLYHHGTPFGFRLRPRDDLGDGFNSLFLGLRLGNSRERCGNVLAVLCGEGADLIIQIPLPFSIESFRLDGLWHFCDHWQILLQ